MNTKRIQSYDKILDERYGKEGTAERNRFNQEAESFYAGQLLLLARKEVGWTQTELAEKAGITKSYVSKIENGIVEPSVGLFFRLINALGLKMEIYKPIV